MKKIYLVFTLSLCAFTALHAQNTHRQKADQYLQDKGEVCFVFNAKSEAQVQELSQILSYGHKPINRNSLEIEAYANPASFQKFLAYNLNYEVRISDNELQFDPHKSGDSPQAKAQANTAHAKMPAWDTTWDAYPTYSQYVAKMNYYATNYSSICSLENIGTTINGRALLVLKISDNPTIKEAEPEFFYTSSMHGDELAGYPIMIRMIDHLLTNYGTDPEVTDLVDNTEIFINPSANPDGTYGAVGSDIINSPTRSNANTQDLNRNYPDNIHANRLHYSSVGGVYENETTAFINYEASKNFVLSANFHGGTELMNYPNDNTTAQHADHDYYEYICVEYATHAQNDSDAYGDFTYMTVDEDAPTYVSPGVTNGATWYIVYGGRQDYMNYFRHSKEVTVELSDQKYLAAAQLPNHWEFNKQALLDYIKQANYGFQGTVNDASGNPVQAKIHISAHDTKNSWVTSSATLGDYYRLIKGGTYSVTYSAPGYISQTVNVTVVDNTKTIQNISLVAITPEPVLSGSFSASICAGNSMTFTATGSGTINWYENIDDNTPVASGTNFTTPTLNASANYYVEDLISNPNVGDSRTNSGGGLLGGSDRYLVFSTSSSVLLKQVSINANQAGEMEVQLQDAAGNMLDTRLILIENPGIQQIDLNFIVPIASNYRLTAVELSSGLNLYRNNTGVSYPYTAGEVSITDSSAGTGFYYFFYDWQIEAYKSSRLAIDITVNPNPIANFSFVVNPLNTGEVDFTNSSVDAATYGWDFGDTTGTSSASDPSYTFASSGTYNVELTSSNPLCGNDIIIVPVTVTVSTLGLEDHLLADISIYPNPFQSSIHINLPNTIKELRLSVFDIRGRRIISTVQQSAGNRVTLSNLDQLSKGSYILQITDLTNGGSITRKLLK